jgi:hypothetical protein
MRAPSEVLCSETSVSTHCSHRRQESQASCEFYCKPLSASLDTWMDVPESGKTAQPSSQLVPRGMSTEDHLLAVADPLCILAFFITLPPFSFFAAWLLTSQLDERTRLVKPFLDAARDAEAAGPPSLLDARRRLIKVGLLRLLAEAAPRDRWVVVGVGCWRWCRCLARC